MTWPTLFDTRLDEYHLLDFPGQQLNAAHATTSLDHALNLDIRAPPGCQRLTGIMAAIGPATYDIEIMQKMMEAGMNMAYLNVSYGTKEDHIEATRMLRQAAENFSAIMGTTYPLAVGIRMSERKIKTGRIGESYGETVEIVTDGMLRLTTDETYKDRCSTYTVYVDCSQLAEQLKKGDIILLDNETIKLQIDVVSLTTLTCKIIRGGILGSEKDVFIPHVILDIPDYKNKIKHDLDIAFACKADFLISSFVYTTQHITEVKDLLGSQTKNMAIIANIQTIEGYRKFDEIVQVADGIMITRQELGSDIKPEKVVIVQKNMIARANKINFPICVSADVLTSMRFHNTPSRSELLDVGNCILDGVDCLVLSGETAVGLYPVETVSCLASACLEAESCLWSKQIILDFINQTISPCDQLTGTAFTAVMAAQRCIASTIIVLTSSGKSAHTVAKYRPRCPILAVTKSLVVAKRLHMWRGVLPVIYSDAIVTDWLKEVENRIKFAISWGIERGFIRVGDPVVIVTGWRPGSGYTNTMRVIYAPRYKQK